MEHLDSEKEQLEQVKDWFKENGMSLVLGIVLGLGGVYGWRGWQSHQVDMAEEASAQLATAEQHLASKEYELAASLVEQLQEDSGNALYTDMSRLLLARVRVEQGMLDKAIDPLRTIVDDKQSVFNTIARLRLARIYMAQSKLDDAKQLISESFDDAYAHAFEELRGDLELAAGQHEAARAAYTNALSLAGISTDTQFLQMKLDDLPGTEQVE